MRNLSIFKPVKKPTRKELIENALKDLDPSVREKAREILETLDENSLKNMDKVKELLRKRGLLYI